MIVWAIKSLVYKLENLYYVEKNNYPFCWTSINNCNFFINKDLAKNTIKNYKIEKCKIVKVKIEEVKV